MGNHLTKKRAVLKLVGDGAFSALNEDDVYDPDDQQALRVRLGPDAWDDMGRPREITVTIEPGDRLND